MSTPTGRTRASTAERRAQLRARAQERLQEERQQPLPGWLATRAARRALALTPALVLVLGVLAAVAGGGATTAVLTGVTSLVASAGTVRLRRATRMLDAAPERLLDEREVGEREVAHRRGYRLTLVLLGVLLAVAVLDGLLEQETGTRLVGGVGWMALLFAALLAASALPAAALAWHWRAPAEDLDDTGA